MSVSEVRKSSRVRRKSSKYDNENVIVPKITTPKKKVASDNENLQCSPPKIKCAESPSNLLEKLSINLTPSKTLEPKKLFSEKSLFQTAKQALHSAAPENMPGRESEIEELREFLTTHINKNISGSIYISGPPGTGKTASISYILDNIDFENKYEKIYFNCTSMKSSNAIYSHIIESLKLKSAGRTERDQINTIENHLESTKKIFLLILDEIDQLESRKQSVLYTLFEWPAKFKSNVVLLGIANALDLTDRILPRLKAHTSLQPRLMHFTPYKKEQIATILTKRLEDAGVLDLFAPVVIQILAGKVAAVSGDVRRALDIARRAVELSEQHHKSVLQPNNAMPNPPKIELKDVMAVFNNVFTTTQTRDQTIEEHFPLQQKVLLCTLILILRKGKNRDVTVGKLHDVYRKVCQNRNILAVDQTEFVSLLSLIETRGILRVFGKKEVRFHKVTLEWDEEEVVNFMKDKNLLSTILDDTNALGSK